MFQTYLTGLLRLPLSKCASAIIINSISDGTAGQYKSQLGNFQEFCESKQHFRFPHATCELCIEYLTSLFKKGLSYSSINTAKAAISQFVILDNSQVSFGNHPLAIKFMKGVFKLRPALPKYNSTWDVTPVLDYLNDLDTSSLKFLTMKCVMLLALTTGQRVQTLAALNLDFMTITREKVVFLVHKILKTSKPGKSTTVEIAKYKDGRKSLCPYECLLLYLSNTKQLRGDNSLWVSFLRPHRTVGSQTISRWLMYTLKLAGINQQFGAHSVRHASSSKAAKLKVPIESILKTVGWASNKTFATFYRRPIIQENAFAEAVLA